MLSLLSLLSLKKGRLYRCKILHLHKLIHGYANPISKKTTRTTLDNIGVSVEKLRATSLFLK